MESLMINIGVIRSNKLAEELRVIPSIAVAMSKSLGVKVAAGYLRNNGFSLEAAVWILLRTEVK